VDVVLVVLALEVPALMALLDCFNRRADEFPGREADRRAWLLWLLVGVATAWILVGNGIVLAYYFVVIKRGSPAT
jgi:hypothetical protein